MKLIQNSVFTLFTVFIGMYFILGRVDRFLHPRMQPFLFGGMLVFGLMAAVGWVQWFQDLSNGNKSNQKIKALNLIYAFLFVVLAMNPKAMTIEAIENRTVNIVREGATVGSAPEGQAGIHGPEPETVTQTSAHDTRISDELEMKDLEDGFEVMNPEGVAVESIWSVEDDAAFEENAEDTDYSKSMRKALGMEEKEQPAGLVVDDFGEVILEMFEHPENYAGEQLTLEGFIYRESGYPEDTFVLCRMMITCCAADAQVVGIYVTSEQSVGLEDGQWVRVKGTVTSEARLQSAGGARSYVITDAELTMIEPYIDPYIFF